MEPESILDVHTDAENILALRTVPETHENLICLGVALAGSAKRSEIEESVDILEKVLKYTVHSEDSRVCVYYLALAHARLQNYDKSVNLLNSLLGAEPSNKQATELRGVVLKKMKREGLLGLGLIGGAAALVGGLVIAGFALRK